ncbi:MAG TPA: tetratricopeptide repeat protein [Devosia sp.]
MTLIARLLSTSMLVTVLATTGAASATTMFNPRQPSPTGSYLAGQAALMSMQTDAAARYMRDALEGEYDHPQLVQTALIAFASNGQIPQAADAARHMLEVDPGNELAHLLVATQELKQGDFAGVAEELDGLGADSFAAITGSILRAWALVGEGKLDEALTSLDPVAANGLDDFLIFHRALMADVAGDRDRAIEFAQKAYEVDPYVARIVEAYARMLGNAGRFDEAEKVLASFANEGLTHPLVTAVATEIDAKQAPGPFADSVQSGASEMFHGIGVALAREGNSELALVFLRLGLYLDPKADVIALVLGQFLDGAGQHTAANALYDAIPAASAMKPTAVVRVAENLDSMGDRQEALRRLGNIVAANPTDVDAISVLGDLQRTDKKYAEAAASYTKAIDVVPGDAPGDWRYYYVRGIAFERNKDWPKAEADFKRALELRPDQPQVLNYLGYSWVDQGLNLNEALEMIEKAVAAAPNDGYIVDSLGWAFYRLGRYEEAVATLEQAVMLRPNDPEINDHLGDAYWRVGRKLEAKFQYNVASSVDTEGNVKDRIARKLAEGKGPLDPATQDDEEETAVTPALAPDAPPAPPAAAKP